MTFLHFIQPSPMINLSPEVNIKRMPEVYVVFGNYVFQQSVCIPMGTNCTPLLAELFLYLYEAVSITCKTLSVKKNLLSPSSQQSGISTTYYQLAIDTSILTSTQYIPEIKDTKESALSVS